MGLTNRLATWWNTAGIKPANTKRADATHGRGAGRHVRPARVAGGSSDGYVQVADRLMAWWNGGLQQDETNRGEASLRIEIDDDLDEQYQNWTDERVSVCAAVWGDGFIQPGTSSFASAVMSAAMMDPKKTILDLSAGMCGTALMFVRGSGVWIDAIEPNPSLARHARYHLASVPIGHQVKLECTALASLEITPGKYHVVYSREAFYTVKSKPHVIAQVAKGLKQDGQFLLLDYVVNAGSEDSPLIAKWSRLEPEQLHLWTLEQYEETFRRNGLSIFASEDFSSTMADEIHNAWLRMLRNLQSGEIDRRNIDHIVREGELWQSRMNALRSGDLKLMRIDTRKSPAKTKARVQKEVRMPAAAGDNDQLVEI